MKLEQLKGIVHSDPEIMGGTPVFEAGKLTVLETISKYAHPHG